MPRKPRISMPGEYFHIIIRGNNRQNIFFTNQDRIFFLSLLEKGIAKYQYKIHAYCLMSNHVHLALEIGEINISKIMHNINFKYAKWVNWTQKRIGHVFQARFKSIYIASKSQLLDLVRYIHFNPVRAKMVRNTASYPWSSHQIYLGKKTMHWVTTKTIFEILDKNRTHSFKKYKILMNEKLPRVEKILGYDNETPLEDFFQILPPENTKKEISFAQIVDFVCMNFSISSNELKKISKNRKYSFIRGIIGSLTRQCKAGTIQTCANYFNRHPSGLVRMINRIEASCKEAKILAEFKKTIEMS